MAPRRMPDRDRAGLERCRHSWTWARVGHPPLPIEPLRTGTAAQRLVQKARAWAADRAEDRQVLALGRQEVVLNGWEALSSAEMCAGTVMSQMAGAVSSLG